MRGNQFCPSTDGAVVAQLDFKGSRPGTTVEDKKDGVADREREREREFQNGVVNAARSHTQN